jgi:RsiW-degrading membrane proteinase PrsW (M82 family)
LNFNFYILLALATAPAFAWMVYIYLKDRHEKEPLGLLLKCFMAGCFSVIPAVLLETYGQFMGHGISQNSYNTFVFAFFVVGLSEEVSKLFMVMLFAYRRKEFNEPFDGIVYCLMVSMGFALVENILYVFSGENHADSVRIGLLRMFTAVPAHATFSIIMGYFLGLAKFKGYSKPLFILAALGGAVLFHGAYDYFFMEVNYPGIFMGGFVSLLVALFFSKRAIKIHQEDSPFRA